MFLAEDPETPSSGIEKSDTSSVAQSIDYELESIDGCSWVTEPPNMMEFDQKTPLGSKQCELQLRYDMALDTRSKKDYFH